MPNHIVCDLKKKKIRTEKSTVFPLNSAPKFLFMESFEELFLVSFKGVFVTIVNSPNTTMAQESGFGLLTSLTKSHHLWKQQEKESRVTMASESISKCDHSPHAQTWD